MESQISGIRLNNNISELTAIAPLKPGKAEELRTVLTALQQRPVNPVEQTQMIHYARWVIIDGGTRLLFNSNSDGSLEDYLEEFAERDEVPLNTIWVLLRLARRQAGRPVHSIREGPPGTPRVFLCSLSSTYCPRGQTGSLLESRHGTVS